MARRYIGRQRGVHLSRSDDDHWSTDLLWGDAVETLGTNGNKTLVRARGTEGHVETAALSDQGLLELYVIDVGQGDGILMRTPDDKWHLLDAGVSNRDQMTRKGTANFLYWKFITELGRPAIELENLIMSHGDFDHFGGMLDLFSGRLSSDPAIDDRTFALKLGNFYHPGLVRYADGPVFGPAEPGEVDPPPISGHRLRRKARFIRALADGRADFAQPPRPFNKTFAGLAACLATADPGVGIRRLSRSDGHLPGYAPGEVAGLPCPLSIAVLGPVVESLTDGTAGLRALSNNAQTINGHSIVLRVDYGDARILLTGDLNGDAMRGLLSYIPADAFAADVAKGCHHGSEDVYLPFLAALQARATVISSGDNEGYSHPRPVLMGASAYHGRPSLDPDGVLQPPLMYSTELARSTRLDFAKRARKAANAGTDWSARDMQVRVADTWRSLDRLPVASDLVYGLVNVRTDGKTILCATKHETGGRFDMKLFQAGRAAPPP